MLKLKPACKDYLWGGDKLRTDFGVESEIGRASCRERV